MKFILLALLNALRYAQSLPTNETEFLTVSQVNVTSGEIVINGVSCNKLVEIGNYWLGHHFKISNDCYDNGYFASNDDKANYVKIFLNQFSDHGFNVDEKDEDYDEKVLSKNTNFVSPIEVMRFLEIVESFDDDFY